MNTIELTELARKIEIRMSNCFIHPEVDAEYDKFSDTILFHVKASLMSDSHMTIRYPDGWWNAVKDKFIPWRLKKYVHIRYKIFEVWRVFPELPAETREMFGESRTLVIPYAMDLS